MTIPALTTTFTPAPTCLNQYYRAEVDCEENHHTCTFLSLGPSSTSECLPSGWGPSSVYFSPGLYCPSGYETATTSVNSLGSATETQAVCCPSGYMIQTETVWPWYLTEPCTSYPAAGNTAVFPLSYKNSQGSWTSTPATISGTGDVNAYGVSLRWQSTDIITPPITSMTSTATSTATSGSSSDAGLSTGAKVGIGVGTAIGCVFVIVIAILLFCLRKKQYPSPDQSSLLVKGAPAHDAPSPTTVYPKSELSSVNQPVEMAAMQHGYDGRYFDPVELDSSRPK